MSDVVNPFEARLLERLEGQFPEREIRISLTGEGRATGARLGTKWFSSALAALSLAAGDAPFQVVLLESGHEPLPNPTTLDPSTAGGLFGQRDAVGLISVSGASGSTRQVVQKVLRVPSQDLLDERGDFHFIAPTSLKRRVVGSAYERVYSRAPILLDRWRQDRNSRGNVTQEMVASTALPLTTVSSDEREVATAPVAWFALHWLESGGAESWALESAQIAADAGYRVLITADVPAPQRLLERVAEITDDVFIPSNVLADEDWGKFLTALMETYQPSVLHIHHSARAYSFLPELRHMYPDVTVLDSTHIVEHRTGGFVRQSIEMSPYIDLHHVISPELRDLYLLDARIEPSKVAYRPLTSSTDVQAGTASTRGDGPLRIGFLGRVAPQKRPFLFVELVRRLNRRHHGQFEYLMQGSGGLSALTDAQIAREGLKDVIIRRPWGPIADFMDSVDVLVITSDNEGLTLTSLEAEEHGVLVLSADVGSQRTVIAPDLLVPRAPKAFLKAAEATLVRLSGSRSAFDEARTVQSELIQALREIEPASLFLSSKLQQLKEKI
ncbi:glycosyltransferase [Oerskovia enterophila]